VRLTAKQVELRAQCYVDLRKVADLTEEEIHVGGRRI
jgi:hypothetical protein